MYFEKEYTYMKIAKEIIENNKYVINTDASFDNLKKIGTYSVNLRPHSGEHL